MTVIVNGYATSYLREGKGPVIVLLHGWGDTSATFKAQIDFLKKHYTVITLDLPGFGKTDRPKEIFDLEKYAEFVADFLKKISEEHIYAYIGHSNGGAIAIKGLSNGLLQSEKLVLLASSGVRSTYTGRKKVLRLAAKAAKYPTKLLPQTTQAKIKKRAYSAIGSDLFVAEHMQETFKQVVSEDLVHEAAMISQPTLLVYGSQDTATPPKYGKTFAEQIEQSQLYIIEGAQHFVHQTHAEKIGEYLKDFLA